MEEKNNTSNASNKCELESEGRSLTQLHENNKEWQKGRLKMEKVDNRACVVDRWW